ncbi:MAG: hypothetical protein LBS71_00770, partial [Puniceicoccales bacterium]|nr:hypothetical protein [Puniceicoccales bacterium]
MKDIKVNIDTSNESINKPTEVKDLHAKSKSQPNIYDVESFQLLLGERVESDKKRAFKRALDNNEHMDSDAKEVDIDEEGLLSIFGSLHMKGDMPNNMGDSLKNYSKLKTESKSKEEVTKITIDSRVESPITYEKKSISDSALDVKDSLANYSELKTESKLKEEVAKITIDSRVESPITYEKKSISDFESSNVRESISDSTLDVKNSLENYSELKTEDRKIPEIVAYLENPETVVNIVKNEKKIENLPITKSPENILTENKTEKEPEKVVLVEHQKNVPENEEEINLIERKSEYKQPQEEENKKEIETSRTEVKQNNLPTNKEGAKFSEVENDKESLDS